MDGKDELGCEKELCAVLKVSRSTFRRRVADGTIDQPIKVGPRANRWWIQATLRKIGALQPGGTK